VFLFREEVRSQDCDVPPHFIHQVKHMSVHSATVHLQEL
jgi:hypothetical protein